MSIVKNNMKRAFLFSYLIIVYVLIFISNKSLFTGGKMGPRPDLFLYGLLINNWYKWILLMGLLCIKKSIEIYFYHYFEHKYTKNTTRTGTHLLYMTIYNMFSWLAETMDYVIKMNSNELQILVPDFISTVISSKYIYDI